MSERVDQACSLQKTLPLLHANEFADTMQTILLNRTYPMSRVKSAIEAAELSPSRVAEMVGGSVRRQHVEYWIKADRLPVRVAAAFERITNGHGRRWDLFPEAWHRIWPELIGTEGAPPIPVEEARDAA